jgi:3-deoxy-D-manno-octulosonic-acid transferase
MLANLIYLAALALAMPLVVYRRLRHGRYRRGVGEKLFGLSAESGRRLRRDATSLVWMHAVSVGEVNLLPGLVRRFEAENRDCRVVISTSTDTGYDLAVRRFGAERVFFCPLDFSWAVGRTLRHLQPQMLVLVELELWPNLVRLATRRGSQVVVVNARLSQRSERGYRRFGWLTRPTFSRLAWVGCQNRATADSFIRCGTPADRIQVTGSLKFDDAPTSRDRLEIQARADWAGVDPWHRVWIVGSTSAGEEAMALEIFKKLRSEHPVLRLILVPRHPERFDEVANLIRRAGFQVHRRSGQVCQDRWDPDTVILVDTIGELRDWWGVGQIATVGGSFGDRGGQNMLEPAGYGCAVCFGPDTRNFRDIAQALIDQHAAVRVQDAAELERFVLRCLDDYPAADSLGRAARRFIATQKGATARTVASLTTARHPRAGVDSSVLRRRRVA